MGSRRDREREEADELTAIHTDSFLTRWWGLPRTHRGQKGWAKSIGRFYLAYIGVGLALVILLKGADLLIGLFD